MVQYLQVVVPELTIMKDVAIAKTAEISEKTVTKIQAFENDPVLMGYCKNQEVIFSMV